MYTNVNLSAPIGALAFLGAGFLVFVAIVLLIYSIATRKPGLTKTALAGLVVIGGGYLAALILFSLVSSERVLARGQEKHFCEIDCHLAYSIVDVKQVKTLGSSTNQAAAAGSFNLITIKTRFDETTIGSARGNSELYPNSRVLTVVDENGRRYWPSTEGQRVLEQTQAAGTPLTTSLRPGESYATNVVFDLPADARNPTLLINEGEWVTYFVIGHENSPFHNKTRFQI